MAEPEDNNPSETLEQVGGKKNLKYFGFVQNATIYVVVHISAVYDYAKEISGPWKPGVQTFETTVKSVIEPGYEKLQNVTSDLLEFVDRKVDDTLNEVNRRMPSLIEQASSQLMYAAQKLPEVARELASELQRDGVVNTATNIVKKTYTKYEPTAKELYTNYEPVAEKYAVSAWRSMNRLPLFPQVAYVVVPTAAYWAEKYNQAVGYTAEKGYPVAQYLPLVPVEKIAKVFEEGENGATVGQERVVET